MLKVRTKDGVRHINPAHIEWIRKPENTDDTTGSVIFLTGANNGIRVKESPDQLAVMQIALTWKPDTMYVEWEDKTNRPAIITAERNFTEYVQKPKEDANVPA